MISMMCYIFLFIFVLCIGPEINCEDVSAAATVGEIVGTVETVTYNKTQYNVSVFLGIPFAESTNGKHRFTKPVKKAPFAERYIANESKPFCSQRDRFRRGRTINNMNEDCLNLNIYVPGKSTNTNSLSVLIWIHGGAFQFGSKDEYQSPAFAALNDVILVTINYRVGVLGFLANKKHSLPGNYGLWDQHMAIRWVHDNIAAFGGDTLKVTLFGGSAGSVSVTLQSLYPGNAGLFQRVIAESGSANCYWALDDMPEIKYDTLINTSQCIFPSNEQILECIRGLSLDKIVEYAVGQYIPVVDGDFVVMTPSEILTSNSSKAAEIMNHFGSIDIIIGLNSYDSAVFAFAALTKSDKSEADEDEGVTHDQLKTLIAEYPYINDVAVKDRTAAIEAVLHQYTDWSDPTNTLTNRQMYLDMVKDVLFTVATINIATAHAQINGTGTSYIYEFDHRASFSTSPVWVLGANHADEVPFVLAFPSDQQLATDPSLFIPEAELKLSDSIMKYWTRFAKTGDPNDANDVDMTQWPAYDAHTQQYIVINTNVSSFPVKDHMRAEYVHFWNYFFPAIGELLSSEERCDNKTDEGIIIKGENIIVTTKIGNIMGTSKNITYNKSQYEVSVFLGIPFAESTSGERRFAKPVKKKPFSQVFVANQSSPYCMQITGMAGVDDFEYMSEDCLHLDIVVPGKVLSSLSHAVMIWIYGGGFQLGQKDIYTSPAFSALNDVILVTINYRLGPYGFMANPDNGIHGNYGLWDQHMAIQWVHDNIAAFGGDPNRVTLFGESAGSASVVYQALYKGNIGLIKNVIAQSGSANVFWAFDRTPAINYDTFLRQTQCKNVNKTQVNACLRNLSPSDIRSYLTFDDSYIPVLDNDFVTVPLDELFDNKTPKASLILNPFGDINIIFGINSFDGAVMLDFMPDGITMNNGLTSTEFQIISENLLDEGQKRTYLEKEAIMYQYTDWTDPENVITARQMYINMATDLLFTASITKAASMHARMNGGGHVYLYEFNHRPSFSNYPDYIEGANHADDLPFTLAFPELFLRTIGNPNITDEEFALSSKMMTYLTQFAKTGNPNSPDEPTMPVWPIYDVTYQRYVVFQSDTASFPVNHHMRAEYVRFWNTLLPSLVQAAANEEDRCPPLNVISSSITNNGPNFLYVIVYTVCMIVNAIKC